MMETVFDLCDLVLIDEAEPCHGAVIMCLRRAQLLGLLRPAPGAGDNLWYGHLQPDVLRAALCSSDEQVVCSFLILFSCCFLCGFFVCYEYVQVVAYSLFLIEWIILEYSSAVIRPFD